MILGLEVFGGLPIPRCCTPAGELRERLEGRDQEVSWADITRVGANPARLIPRMHQFISAHPGRGVRCVQEPIWQVAPARSSARRSGTKPWST